MQGRRVQRKDQGHLTALAAWVGRELLPPVVRWVAVERLPLEARAIQARARRALAIGEIDEHVHAYVTMRTDAILRWCWAEGAGVKTSAWIEPNGQVNAVEYGQHWNWIKANGARLAADGVADEATCQSKPAAAAMKMMQAGWIRYSGGVVMTMPMPNEAQAQAIDGLIREAGAPQGFAVQFFIEGAGVRGEVPAEQVVAKGTMQVLAELGQGAPAEGEVPLGKHRLAAMGGPFDTGDGQDVGSSYQEQAQDGSTAPTERGTEFMPQDLQPEVWWQRNLLDYLKKSYPGQPSSGPQSDADSTPVAPGVGQAFASVVTTVIRAVAATARREREVLAEISDPSDPDGQHDQLEGFTTHPVDRADPQEQRRTRLGERWRQRRSDKAVEQQIIQMEKNHLEPDQIESELRQDGIPSKVIDETYENREKNLFKIVEVGANL